MRISLVAPDHSASATRLSLRLRVHPEEHRSRSGSHLPRRRRSKRWRSTTTGSLRPPLTVLQHQAPSPRRFGLLVGVVQRQLERATRYFDSGHEEMAVAAAARRAVPAARGGAAHRDAGRPERRPEPAAPRSLASSATKDKPKRCIRCWWSACRRAPSGRTRSSISRRCGAGSRTRARPGSMQARAAAQQAALQQALLDPSAAALERARSESLTVDRASAHVRRGADAASEPVRAGRKHGGVPRHPHRRRSLGGAVPAPGRRAGALAALDDENVASHHRAQPARAGGERRRRQRSGCLGGAVSPVRVGGWGVGRIGHDARPRSGARRRLGRGARAVSGRAAARSAPRCRSRSLLLAHGMAEVAPLILEQALEQLGSDARGQLGSALRAGGDPPGRERSATCPQRAARSPMPEPLIKLSQREVYGGRVTPSASRLHFFMGAIEAGAGELARAHPQLGARRQARAHRGRAAPARLDRPAAPGLQGRAQLRSTGWSRSPRARGMRRRRRRSQLLRFEVLREMGDNAARRGEPGVGADAGSQRAHARRRAVRSWPSRSACSGACSSSTTQRTPRSRAAKRAYEASRNDIRQMTETVLDSSRRALTLGDLRAARDSVRRAVSRRPGGRGHGVRRALAQAARAALAGDERRHGGGGAGSDRRADGLGRQAGGLGSRQAVGAGAARSRPASPIERVEATFYVAMSSPDGRARAGQAARSGRAARQSSWSRSPSPATC